MVIVLAFVEDQVKVACPPGATVAGAATSCTVGALAEVGEGDGFGVGVGVALLAFTPPHPVRISSAEADMAKAILVTVKR
jgi:hypothetical protein